MGKNISLILCLINNYIICVVVITIEFFKFYENKYKFVYIKLGNKLNYLEIIL